MPHLAMIMMASGVGIPILAALNAGLGRSIGSPAAAAVVLFAVAMSAAVVAMLVTVPGGLARLPLAPRHLMLGGLFVAFYVLAVTWIAPVIGVGNAVFWVLLGQLLSAAAIDHFGLFGALRSPLTLSRAAGIGLMMAGIAVTQRL